MIKILWIYKYDPRYNFDHHLHMDVAEDLNNFSNVKVIAYGKGLHESNPRLCPFSYREDMTLLALYNAIKFDLIIVNTKSRCFDYYCPPLVIGNTEGERRKGELLPSDFSTFNKTPKIMIEEDYHYEVSDDWYKEKGFNLILQRHYSNFIKGKEMKSGIEHRFFPFSVDINKFYDKKLSRINKITYVGSLSEAYYSDRLQALRKLSAYGLLQRDTEKHIVDNCYIDNLNKYVGHLSGQSNFFINPAKNLEIISSGSLLISNNHSKAGLEYILPNDCYISYDDTSSDIVSKVQYILNNSDKRLEIVEKATKYVRENHNHQIRHQQLLDIIGKI